MSRQRRRNPSRTPVPPEFVGVTLLVAHNLLAHRVLRPPADSALNLASAALLTGFARRVGCTREELGIDRAHLRSGLRTGAIAAAGASSVVGIAAAIPATRAFFEDARFEGMSRDEALFHAALRIPVAVALAEEIIFRSVLHALFFRKRGLARTLTWTSLLFGLWHILPTLDGFEGNPVSKIAAEGHDARVMTAAGISGATAAAGLYFSFLRVRSRSVIAPVLTHAAINVAAWMIGRTLVERRKVP